MKDYQVTLTVKNNHLFRHMQLKDIKTSTELSQKSGVSYPTINNYLALRTALMGRDGWKVTAVTLAKFFNCKPEDLFPEQHINEPLEKNKASFEMSRQDVMEITSSLRQTAISPETVLVLEQSKDYFDQMIKKILNPRQYEILQRRFGLESGHAETFEEVSKKLDISRGYARVIEQGAISKIKREAALNPRFMSSVKAIMGLD